MLEAARVAGSRRFVFVSTEGAIYGEGAGKARLLGELDGSDGFEPEFAAARAAEVQRISLNPGRAERELGWKPQTDLETGLRLTLSAI